MPIPLIWVALAVAGASAWTYSKQKEAAQEARRWAEQARQEAEERQRQEELAEARRQLLKQRSRALVEFAERHGLPLDKHCLKQLPLQSPEALALLTEAIEQALHEESAPLRQEQERLDSLTRDIERLEARLRQAPIGEEHP